MGQLGRNIIAHLYVFDEDPTGRVGSADVAPGGGTGVAAANRRADRCRHPRDRIAGRIDDDNLPPEALLQRDISKIGRFAGGGRERQFHRSVTGH